jgi:uncharacterized repeat protein (TIGR01451 family)
VQIYDTLPAGALYYPGSPQDENYSGNNAWRFTNSQGDFSSALAIGPFTIPVGQAVTVQFPVKITVSGSEVTDTAMAQDGAYLTTASGQCDTLIAAAGITPTFTGTFTISPTFTITKTTSPTPTASGTLTPTPTNSPQAMLALVKSSSAGNVNVAGDTLTYTLALSNGGAVEADGVTVWDTLPANFTLQSSSPTAAQVSGGVISWNLASLAVAGTAPFYLWGTFNGTGTFLQNQAAAAFGSQPPVYSNTNLVAVGATFTSSPTPSITPSSTASPTATPTTTIALGPPILSISMAINQGDPWPTLNGSQNLGFLINFSSKGGCLCNVAPDLILTFNSDTGHSGLANSLELDAFQAMSVIGCAGPGNPLANFYWKQLNGSSEALLGTGTFSLLPGQSVSKEVYAFVESNYLNTSITSQAVLSSATYGISVSATVSTLIYAAQPPTPTNTPTPIAGLGHTVAYPQPAKDNLCIAYYAPQGGPLTIEVYNMAFRRVAVIRDSSQGGQLENTCVDISKLASGLYLYKAKVGDYAFPTARFGVLK